MPFWERAGVADRIERRTGEAWEVLAALPRDPVIDLALVDAAEDDNPRYLDELLPRLPSSSTPDETTPCRPADHRPRPAARSAPQVLRYQPDSPTGR